MKEIWKQWEGRVVDGKFPLQQYLGGSGHGIVFLTERNGPGSEKAAIKLVLEIPAQAETRLSVWRQTANLSHPNLLQVFDSGRCRLDDTALLYVVMEYAEEDLSQVLPQRPLDAAEAQEMLPPVVKALAYLHGKGFVHGHLKPANVVAIGDQVKLSSDGLCALAGASGSWADYPGMDVHDPVHDPPEAKEGTLTPAADVWALGVTLVEALTLRRHIWDRTERNASKEPELILPDGIPGPFLDVVRHCLIPDARRRWTTAEIVARLEGRAIESPEPEAVRSGDGEGKSSQIQPTPNAGAGGKKAAPKWLYPAIAVVAIALIIVVVAKMRRPALSSDHKFDQEQTQPGSSEARLPMTAVTAAQGPLAQNQSAPKPAVALRRAAGGKVPGAVRQQVLPQISNSARSSIEGHVRVSVQVAVDALGNVADASLESPGPSKYFAHQALQAAQGWKFTPAKMKGQSVPSKWILKFAFSSAGTDVRPSEVSP